MNRLFRTSFTACVLVAICLSTAVSCKEDVPYMEVSPASVSFTQSGGTQSVSLSTNSMSWSASVSGTGFSVSPTSGAGNASLTITANPASSSNDVTGTVTITSGTLKASVALSQSAKNTLTANGETSISAEGGNYTVTLKYNTDYSVEVSDNATSWIQYNGTKALSEATLSFTVAANTGAERTGTISIKDKANVAATATVTLTQKEPAMRTSLMALYNALGGSNWDKTKSEGWASDKAVSEWTGVYFNESNELIGLNLNGFGLNGDIPEDIANFKELSLIDLGNNASLTGNIPASWANLTALTTVRLSQTSVSGTLPLEWASLTALTQVEISGTSVEGPLPTDLFNNWTLLQTLDLSANENLSGILPVELDSLETLVSVKLNSCHFTGGIPAEWGNLPVSCVDLQVYGNKLTDEIPLAIQGHENWTNGKWDAYKDSDTHFLRTQQDNVFLDLEKVPNAQRDVLMSLFNNLDGKNWPAAKKKNWNTDNDISTWGGVTVANDAIVELNLNGFGLKGELPEDLSALTSLVLLDLGNNPNLKGTLPSWLANLTLMRDFSAHHTGLSTPLTQEVILGWKHLRSLALYNNSNFTGTLPVWLGEITTDQTSLSIQLQNGNFTGGVPAEWASLPAACQQLYLYGNKLTERIPKAILSHKNWTTEKWDCIVTGTTHGIRTQQNSVYLELEATLPTVSAVTVTKMAYNQLILQASVLTDGGGNVTDRGFVVNETSRRVGSGVGSFTSTFNSLNPNTVYTLKAFATNSAGTAYGPEMTVTTPAYTSLTVSLADTTGETLRRVEVSLSRIGDVAPTVASTARTTSARMGNASAQKLSFDGTAEEVVRQVSKVLLRQIQPYMNGISENAAQLGKVSSSRRNYVLAADAVAPDFSGITDADGRLTVEGLIPGQYSMKVIANGYYPFFTHVNIQEGSTTLDISNVPIKEYDVNFVALYQNNTATRAFVSPTNNDNVIALTNFDASIMAPYVDQKLRQLIVFKADTTSSIAIVANSVQDLQDTYNVLMSLYNSEGELDFQGAGNEVLISLLKTHAQRILILSNLPTQTCVVNHSAVNMKSLLLAQMDESALSMLSMVGVTTDVSIPITSGNGFVVNMIMGQRGSVGTLMTDGDGPAQTGGNTLGLSSREDVTTLSDMGYQGNWHIGIGVR